jgi:hypothetical protein
LAGNANATYIWTGRRIPHDGTDMDWATFGDSPSPSQLQGNHVNPEKLTAHLRVDRYGEFQLTDAIRPSLDLQVVPREGFRMEIYRDPRAGLEVPVLAAAISRERLFDLFLDLLAPLGHTVDVVLETSHDNEGNSHRDLYREQIELPVLMSHLCDFESLLVNDGCTGVAVISNEEPMEVQFDEHKLLVVYARDLEPFERILRQADIPRDDELKLITEGEHLHSTDPHHGDAFEQLCYRLGIGAAAEHVNW